MTMDEAEELSDSVTHHWSSMSSDEESVGESWEKEAKEGEELRT